MAERAKITPAKKPKAKASTNAPAAKAAPKAAAKATAKAKAKGAAKAKAKAQATKQDPKKKKQAKRKAKRIQEVVETSFEVDESARHEAVVEFFSARNGYGFIVPSKQDLVPAGKLMVHWKDIETTDSWPQLAQDMKVEFSLSKKVLNESKALLRAVKISMPGGGKVNIQTQQEASRQWVGSKKTRHLGTMLWFNSRIGFGIASLNSPVDDITQVRLSREEIAGEGVPLAKGLVVEFSLFRDAGDVACGARVTQPGGKDITLDLAENRQHFPGSTLYGEVQWYQARSGIGFILPEEFDSLPEAVQIKSTQAAQKKANATQKEAFEGLTFRKRDLSAPGIQVAAGTRVSYSVYTDNRGAGAANVALA